MRPKIDGALVLLLLLTAVAVVSAEQLGLYWVLLGIALVKGVVIQVAFMGLGRHPGLLVGLTGTALAVGVAIGVVLGA